MPASRTAQHARHDPDPTVIARAARGDGAAFSQIYEHCAPRLHRYVRSMVSDQWDAEDVTQEVFVKIFTGLGRYTSGRASFTAWTLRVARNAAIDHVRRRRGRAELGEVDPRAALDDVGRGCRESLRQVLGELEPHQREVLVLRAYAGFEPSEVAVYAGASRGSINTLYHRARVTARDRLRAMAAGPCTRTVARRTPATPVLAEAAFTHSGPRVFAETSSARPVRR
jgi:RNA polymerase sigma-70 factor (ECF subfamily)